MRRKALKYAVHTCMPVILGYIPAGFAFGLMLSAIGGSVLTSLIMAVTMYAGAGQYIAVDFIKNNATYFTIAVTTFLVNSKHLFYGLSLIDKYKNTGVRKLYLMFSLTDETYALLTSTAFPKDVNKNTYMLYVSFINQISWICGCVLGSLFGKAITFDTKGLDFAMTALFIVIITEQWQNFKTKLPFIIGAFSIIVAMVVLGKSYMLLGGAVLSVILLILFKERIEKNDNN
ncbi:MAG: AzlC family ABC transporter permease [Lachnospirales bacterium]